MRKSNIKLVNSCARITSSISMSIHLFFSFYNHFFFGSFHSFVVQFIDAFRCVYEIMLSSQCSFTFFFLLLPSYEISNKMRMTEISDF